MQTFTTFDGADQNGTRAEVYVQKGEGVVSDIKETKRGTADIFFTVENMKYPVHGWVNVDSDTYTEALKSKNDGTVTTFRIESQRKPKVDRETPIQTLRETMDSAKANVITILAEVGGKTSAEAVTSPEEDPAPTVKGRIKATPNSTPTVPASANQTVEKIKEIVKNNVFTEDVISHLAAFAISQGADIKTVAEALASNDRKDLSNTSTPRSGFSVESPSWRAFNSDGRTNLGYSAIQAISGAELFVRNQIREMGIKENHEEEETAVKYFTTLILLISDKIQKTIYGGTFRPDRAVSSHVKIRGIVFDTIDHMHPLPLGAALTESKISEWVKTVGNTAYQRFKTALEIYESDETLETLKIPTLLTGPETIQTSPVAPAGKTEETTPVEPATIEEETPPEPQPSAPEPEATVNINETEKPAAPGVQETNTVKYPQSLLDETLLKNGKIDETMAATEETIETFKNLVQEFDLTKTEVAKISKLLGETFGPKFTKAQTIPDETLLEFIDFYVASGPENFKEVLNEL